MSFAMYLISLMDRIVTPQVITASGEVSIYALMVGLNNTSTRTATVTHFHHLIGHEKMQSNGKFVLTVTIKILRSRDKKLKCISVNTKGMREQKKK